MKTLHMPFCFHPDPVGGTEVYVEGLCRRLIERGVEAVVAAPAADTAEYDHRGLRVRRFKISKRLDLNGVYSEGDTLAAESFRELLHCEKPHVAHFHALTPAISLRLLREATRAGIPTVFTYHTPMATCARGTLLQWGAVVCDGFLDARLCAGCSLHGLGLPRPAARLVASAPAEWNEAFSKVGLAGGVCTALRMHGLVTARHALLRCFFQEVDHIVAVCEWVRALLLRNGVRPEKILLSRHGVSEGTGRERPPKAAATGSLRIAFLGRVDRVKGVHVLLNALRRVPRAPVRLDIYGTVQGNSGERYARFLRDSAKGDPRIAFHDPVPPEETVSLLARYDVLAVPSQWLETGPLVVLEAFAAGTPVIGSDLGGIAELVTDNVNGVLVKADSTAAWSAAILDLSEKKERLEALRSRIVFPRTMNEVADEMARLYGQMRRCG